MKATRMKIRNILSRPNKSRGVTTRRFLVQASVIIASFAAAALLAQILVERKACHRASVCVGNLADLNLAKSYCAEETGAAKGAILPINCVQKFRDPARLVCPEGGQYSINRMGEDPTCSYTNVCNSWAIDFKSKRIVRQTWRHKR